jgi:hypothetical protein
MNEEIQITNEVHLFTSEEKIKWLGYGEWVEELDVVKFTYKGIECRINRIVVQEPYTKELHVFGGHLCGYVRIPAEHPYHHKRYEEMEIDCHYGLTYGEVEDGEVEDGHWIGFDCGHLGDYVPSMEYLKKTNPTFQVWKKKEEKIKKLIPNSPIGDKSYKNINYCIGECKGIVDQLLDMRKKSI